MVSFPIRRGASKLGCLVSLLIAAVVLYFGANAGEVYFRYYRFSDAVKQEARFARQNSDDAIRSRLAAIADSLGLPEEATRVQVVRTGTRIVISADYVEPIELPGMIKLVRFRPSATGDL